MAWSYTASTFATTSSINPIPSGGSTLLLGVAPNAGDRIVVGVVVFKSTAPGQPTVTDDINGTYTEDASTTFTDGSNQVRVSIFSKANVSSTRPTIKVVSGTGANRGGFCVAAYGGLLTSDPGTDVSHGGNGGGVNASSGATTATAAANELVVGFYGDTGWATTLTTGAGFTSRGKHDGDGDSYQGLFEDKDSGASGSTATATATSSTSVTWGQVVAVYQLAGAGGGGAKSPMPYRMVNRTRFFTRTRFV